MNAAQLHLKPDTWVSIITPRDVWHLIGKPVTIKVRVLNVTEVSIGYDLTPMGFPLVRGAIGLNMFHTNTKYLYERSRPWCEEILEVELSAEQLAFMTDWRVNNV